MSGSGKYLVINGDDFASSEAANRAVVRAFQTGILTSTNLMAPCAWLPHAAKLVKEHNISCGVHLTLTCEYELYQFGPLTKAAAVTRDGKGQSFIKNPNDLPKEAADAIYQELRAQVERCMDFGVQPEYLDAHMGVVPRWDNAFAGVCERLYEKFKIPFRTVNPERRAQDLPLDTIGGVGSGPKEKSFKQRFREQLETMKPGNHWLLCHPAELTAETLAMEIHPGFAKARQDDVDLLCDPEVRGWMKELGVQLVTSRELKTL